MKKHWTKLDLFKHLTYKTENVCSIYSTQLLISCISSECSFSDFLFFFFLDMSQKIMMNRCVNSYDENVTTYANFYSQIINAF